MIFEDWFWIRRRRLFGGLVIGFFKIFSIWITRDGFELTISELDYRPICLWWKKIDVGFYPFEIIIINRR